jgi:Fe-Mn family superoxide dismutase
MTTRRDFISITSAAAAGVALGAHRAVADTKAPPTNAKAGVPAGEHKAVDLPFVPSKLKGLSAAMLTSHHDNNYAGAVKNLNKVELELQKVDKDTPGFASASFCTPTRRSSTSTTSGTLAATASSPVRSTSGSRRSSARPRGGRSYSAPARCRSAAAAAGSSSTRTTPPVTCASTRRAATANRSRSASRSSCSTCSSTQANADQNAS